MKKSKFIDELYRLSIEKLRGRKVTEPDTKDFLSDLLNIVEEVALIIPRKDKDGSYILTPSPWEPEDE